jgi:hypothetical protein
MRPDFIITGFGMCFLGIGLLMVAAAISVHDEYHRPSPARALDIIGRLEHAEPEDRATRPGDSGDVPTPSSGEGGECGYVGRRRGGEIPSDSREYVSRH